MIHIRGREISFLKIKSCENVIIYKMLMRINSQREERERERDRKREIFSGIR